MKTFLRRFSISGFLLPLVMLGSSLCQAADTESRSWSATSGHTAEGVATAADAESVTLRLEDGSEVELALMQLVEADRELLAEQFDFELPEVPALVAQSSGATPLTGLAQPQGELLGPLEANENAHYFLYLPQSLKVDRPAPLLVWSSASGGGKGKLRVLVDVAERFGVILCTSQEARNVMADGLDRMEVSKAMIDEVIADFPVDADRLFCSGGSGGGAFSFPLAREYDAIGLMPAVAYNPFGDNFPRSVESFYWLGGGHDFNRYATAQGRKLVGRGGFHRMWDGGHGGMPGEQLEDGLFWLLARHYGQLPRAYPEDKLDFEAAALLWLEEISEEAPYRAYSNALVMQEALKPSPTNAPLLQSMIARLGEDPINVRYRQGLLAIDQFSQDYFAAFGSGTKKKHKDERTSAKALELAEEYEGVPELPAVMRAMAAPTD